MTRMTAASNRQQRQRMPIHDYTQQDKEFGYMSYVFNPENRLSLIFGNATNRFQIPDNPGQMQNIQPRRHARLSFGKFE